MRAELWDRAFGAILSKRATGPFQGKATMIDLRILAAGAMALLIAAYGASTAVKSHVAERDSSSLEITGSIKKAARLSPAGAPHVDGFDLTH